MEETGEFNVVLLGVIYDPSTKKILIGRRESDPHLPRLEWCFPGGRLRRGEKLGDSFKERIKEKTGLEVANLGSIFSKVYPEKDNLIAIYFLSEKRDGEEKAQQDFVELKWVSPEEIEEYFKVSFHPRLKEYIINLK